MSAPVVLLAHSIRRARTLVLALGTLLAIFQVLLVQVARSIERSGAFEQIGRLIPEFVREVVGPAFGSFMSFNGIVSLGYFHPVVMAVLIASVISLATMVTGEMENGFMDLILSRPLARHWLITRSIILGMLGVAAPLALMLLGTTVGLGMLAPKELTGQTLRLVLALAGNLGLLMLCWCGVALAISSAARRRGTAGWAAGLVALGTFLLDYVGRAWKPLERFCWISPFRYYSPFDLLMGKSLPMTNLLVLAAIAAAGFALAYFFFRARDIPH